MFTNDYYIVFPEGDIQEVPGRLGLSAIVDINGRPLSLPLLNNRIIAFRITRIQVQENRGGNETYHYLELLSAEELLEYTAG